ncbi:MAG TPA: bifunctional nuclease family protein [Dehalococcoidia bacterium]|nr:bifunctional nuclease family protein [Dehalococcoidia bacterium]|tara:strand:- start:662 stop:1204 length:543 start_codon:yes stop_codon:yes gene_type:complete
MLEMTIDSIRVSPMNYQRIVILKQKDGEKYLPIWIGPQEADAIAVKLQDMSVPRPLTHDLLCSLLEVTSITIKHILINNLESDTFYAKIYFEISDKVEEIDSRPSDAIALAVRTGSPIYVEEDVIEKAGVKLDEDGKPITTSPSAQNLEKPEIREEELKSMSAFTEFINNLDLEDFDQNK